MPSQQTGAQKAMVAEFARVTGASERTAARLLRSYNYKLDEAADAYFNSSGGLSGSNPAAILESELGKLFDSLRDDEQDTKDLLGVDSSMNYLSQELKVNLEDAELLVAFDILQVQTVGEITRSGFVEGWKATGMPANHKSHATFVRNRIAALSADPNYFKQVYRHTFVAGKEPTQKALGLENAVVYWGLLFSSPGRQWATKSHDWLELWTAFLKEKWTRSVNRDMWNQALEFATKSMADETLSFWKEDGAWPSVIDDFVAWCRERGGVGKVETMDVDQ